MRDIELDDPRITVAVLREMAGARTVVPSNRDFPVQKMDKLQGSRSCDGTGHRRRRNDGAEPRIARREPEEHYVATHAGSGRRCSNESRATRSYAISSTSGLGPRRASSPVYRKLARDPAHTRGSSEVQICRTNVVANDQPCRFSRPGTPW